LSILLTQAIPKTPADIDAASAGVQMFQVVVTLSIAKRCNPAEAGDLQASADTTSN